MIPTGELNAPRLLAAFDQDRETVVRGLLAVLRAGADEDDPVQAVVELELIEWLRDDHATQRFKALVGEILRAPGLTQEATHAIEAAFTSWAEGEKAAKLERLKDLAAVRERVRRATRG